MEAFQPIVNFLAVMTALSVAAERLTQLWKLKGDAPPAPRGSGGSRPSAPSNPSNPSHGDRARELRLTRGAYLAGLFVALLLKADFFAMAAQLDAPWTTLGWVRIDGHRWVRAEATRQLASTLWTLVGCSVTSLGLGFGAKFWHDILGTVLELRRLTRRIQSERPKE